MASFNHTLPQTFGQLSQSLSEMRPYIPMSIHLILSALFPIYTGAHASLSRPSSAAEPPKKDKDHKSEEDEDDEDESILPKMEGLSPTDAIIFPVLAGLTLGGLYLLIKYMGPDLLNKILGVYFSGMALFSVAKLLNDSLAVLHTFIFPTYYLNQGRLWRVNQKFRKATEVLDSTDLSTSDDNAKSRRRPSPLPAIFSRLPLPDPLLSILWTTRGLPLRKIPLKINPTTRLPSIDTSFTIRSIIASLLAATVILCANLYPKAWYLTNVQGFAFSYTALQLLSPTTFFTGSLLLAALFVYDIYFVFYTPLMVTVASELDVPIKLLFPRPEEEDREDGGKARRLAMLGLGDVVLPGIMVGLSLRFDLFLEYVRRQRRVRQGEEEKQEDGEGKVEKAKTEKVEGEDREEMVVKAEYKSVTSKWGDRFWTGSLLPRMSVSSLSPTFLSFSARPKGGYASLASSAATKNVPTFAKPYFTASIIGYVLGMSVTLIVMQVFKHAQPALLYLVPGVLGAVWLTALVRGEFKDMWQYSEAMDMMDSGDKDKERGKESKKDT